MICKIRQVIDKHYMINNGDSIAVGFSGGADSVCLLHVLTCLKDEYDIVLKAVHINHNIRGDEALRDEKFCKEFCQKNGVEFVSFSVDVPALAKEKGISEELCGRQIRYQCFHKLGTDKIAVAHTLSDSAETLLFNLARGTGMKGICGISAVRDNIIRPLIECTREEIEAYCEANGLPYMTDSTNLSDDYTRNKLRHGVIPVLKSINPSFERNILRLTQNIRLENDFIETEVFDLIESSVVSGGYSRSVLFSAHPAVYKRAVASIIASNSEKDIEDKHISLCLSVLKAGKGAVEISKGTYFCADSDKIYIDTAKNTENKVWNFHIFDSMKNSPFENFAFEITTLSQFVFEKNKAVVDISGINEYELILRSRQAGDKLSSSRRKNTKTLKKLFTETKVPEEKRNSVAVLSFGKDVLWVDGFGVDSKYEVNKNTEKILIIEKKEK